MTEPPDQPDGHRPDRLGYRFDRVGYRRRVGTGAESARASGWYRSAPETQADPCDLDGTDELPPADPGLRQADEAALAVGFSRPPAPRSRSSRDGAGVPVIDVPAAAWVRRRAARPGRPGAGLPRLALRRRPDGRRPAAPAGRRRPARRGHVVGRTAGDRARYQRGTSARRACAGCCCAPGCRTTALMLASLTGVWPGVAWHERETFEMFGIDVRGLRRRHRPGCGRCCCPTGSRGRRCASRSCSPRGRPRPGRAPRSPASPARQRAVAGAAQAAAARRPGPVVGPARPAPATPPTSQPGERPPSRRRRARASSSPRR